jgi:hypothetical protein
MNYSKFLLSILLISLGISGIFVNAQAGAPATATQDCSLVQGIYTTKNGFDLLNSRTNNTKIPNAQEIIDTDSLNVAMLNLKKYCCENQPKLMTTCRQDKDEFRTTNTPQSPYLFDHLLDVLMRRLDGETANVYEGVSVDKK